MFYVLIAIAIIAIFMIYAVCKASSENDCKELIHQDIQILRYEKKIDILKSLADEQNQSLNELKAGMHEKAFVGFENVKDELERLVNEEELNTDNDDNV